MSIEDIGKRRNSENESKNVSSDQCTDERRNEDSDFFDYIEAITDEMDTMTSESK